MDEARVYVREIRVKNNNISNLVRDVSRQIKQRNVHLPEGMKQYIKIDVRGQSVPPEIRVNITKKIVERCNGIISAKQIEFVRK